MGLLDLAADGLWIIAMTIMAAASASVWRRIRPGTSMPMLLDEGRPAWRLPRAVALCLIPAAALATSLVLLVVQRVMPHETANRLMLFGLRVALAGGFALAHILWLKAALAVLDAEGELGPWESPRP